MSQRIFAIGDIHGGLKALQQILKKAAITPNDLLIFLGDYVDGWSDSAHVVSYLIELEKKQPCVFIRGNHDDLVHQWLITQEMNNQWLQHGGESTIKSYAELSEKEINTHIAFYERMKNYYVLNEEILFLHAGFTNMHGPYNEYEAYMCYWDRTLWETALSLDPNLPQDHIYYPKRLKLFKEIYIGHTPVTRINKEKPHQAANVINVDTGAAFKGKLSMIEINTKEVYQSEPVYQIYKDEKGRN